MSGFYACIDRRSNEIIVLAGKIIRVMTSNQVREGERVFSLEVLKVLNNARSLCFCGLKLKSPCSSSGLLSC